jgi:hypothetical protein
LNTAREFPATALLPNGKVLVAGGFNNNIYYLVSAELYDPVSGTWTVTGSLNTAREYPTATLLPNGKVLVAGGYKSSSGYLASVELYDPASGTWVATDSLDTARESPPATLLPNGRVLVAGGWGTSGYLADAELYDVGLGFNASWRPQIATVTSPLLNGRSLALTGSRFRGVSEGSGGNTQDSPADYPVVQLRSLGNEQTLFLSPMNWSTNSYNSAPVTGLPPGYALVTVFVNGIPSAASILSIGALPLLNITYSGNSVVVFWPSASTGWTLQQRSNLAAGSWATNSFTVSDDGTNKSITITSPTGNLFFRLYSP